MPSSFKDQVLRSTSYVGRHANGHIRSTHLSVLGLRQRSGRDIRNIPGVIVRDDIGNANLVSNMLSIGQESFHSSGLPTPEKIVPDDKKDNCADRGNFGNTVMKYPPVQNRPGKQQQPSGKLMCRVPKRKQSSGNNTLVLRSSQAQAFKLSPPASSFVRRRKKNRIRMPPINESDESED